MPGLSVTKVSLGRPTDIAVFIMDLLDLFLFSL